MAICLIFIGWCYSITYSGSDSLATERLSKLEVFRAVSMDSILQSDRILVAFKDTFATTDLGKLDAAARQLDLNMTKGAAGKLTADVNAIAATDTIASMWKELLVMAYSKWADDDTTTVLSGADSTRLWDIGALCPYQNGPAVYLARTMLFSLDSAYFALRNDCEKPNYVAPSYRIGQFPEEEGTDGVDEELRVNVFPNPTKGVLQVRFIGELKGSYQLRVICIDGRTVFRTLLNAHLQSIDLHGLSEGLYLIIIHDRNGNAVLKNKIAISK